MELAVKTENEQTNHCHNCLLNKWWKVWRRDKSRNFIQYRLVEDEITHPSVVIIVIPSRVRAVQNVAQRRVHVSITGAIVHFIRPLNISPAVTMNFINTFLRDCTMAIVSCSADITSLSSSSNAPAWMTNWEKDPSKRWTGSNLITNRSWRATCPNFASSFLFPRLHGSPSHYHFLDSSFA